MKLKTQALLCVAYVPTAAPKGSRARVTSGYWECRAQEKTKKTLPDVDEV